MKNNNEVVISLTVPQGEKGFSKTMPTLQGDIVACVVYHGEKNNTGFVRASIEDYGGKPLSKTQAIENYRSRDNVDYYKSGKPLFIEGGAEITFSVNATDAFTEDFKAELILIYGPGSLESGLIETC